MKKVFIIDDEETFLRMIERVFVARGFEVETSLEGADALAKLYLMDALPSAILLDIMIPVLSGIEVLKKLKESARLKNVPVIMLTNLTPSDESEERIVALGAVKYLHKADHTAQEIFDIVEAVVTTHELSDEHSAAD